MSVPDYIKHIIQENQYSILFSQTRSNESVPKTSSIHLRQNGRTLCTILYEFETDSVCTEMIDTSTIDQAFLGYFKSILEAVGRQIWLSKIESMVVYPEPLEELFQLGRKYF